MNPKMILVMTLVVALGGTFARQDALMPDEAFGPDDANVFYQAVATDPSPPANAPGQAVKPSDADLQAQLDDARRRLEEAAREVADLSTQIGGPIVQQFSISNGAFGQAIIGVQLQPGPEKDGAHVLAVSPGGPADEAGIRAGDVIVAVNGTEVKGEDATRKLVKIIRDVKPDGKLSVRVLRDGKPRDFTVTARPGPGVVAFGRAFPDLPPMPQMKQFFMVQGPLSNMELATLTPQLGKYFGTDKGVLVVRAPADGTLKLEDGDVILAIDGREPTSGSHATRILGSYQPGEKLTLRIVRQHKTLDVETTVPEDMGGPQRRGVFINGGAREAVPVPGKIVITHREDEAI